MTDAPETTTPAITSPVITDPREAWLIKRRGVITGTDLAALFGVDRYGKTPMKVWLDKTGREPAQADNNALRFGRRFERPILEEYAEQKQVELAYPGAHALIIAPEYPFLGATLDAQHVLDKTPVDAKNMGFRSLEFGPDGSDIVPLAYALQLTAQMIVTGAERSALAVLFNRYEFNTFQVVRDPIVVERILERAARFMTDHVQADTPPPVDGSASWTEWLGGHLKQRNKTILKAGPEEHEFAVALHTTNTQIKTLQEEADGLKNRLKLAIGEAYGMEGPEWRALWSESKDREKIDWEHVARNLAQLVETMGVEEGDGSQALNALVKTCTVVTPGPRSFKFTFHEESPA